MGLHTPATASLYGCSHRSCCNGLFQIRSRVELHSAASRHEQGFTCTHVARLTLTSHLGTQSTNTSQSNVGTVNKASAYSGQNTFNDGFNFNLSQLRTSFCQFSGDGVNRISLLMMLRVAVMKFSRNDVD